MADELVHKAAEILGQLQALSPKVVDVALRATQADALASIIMSAFWLGLAVISGLIVWRKVVPWARKSETDDFLGFMVPSVLAVIIGAVGLVSLISLADPWNYIALLHPELWIAHKIIGAA